jgi:hypothetical protein
MKIKSDQFYESQLNFNKINQKDILRRKNKA